MTHNSLIDISVTLATLHALRGWLKEYADKNTVHQYRGINPQKRQKGEGVRSHEHSRHLEREGNTRKGDTGEAETSILMTHNSLPDISVTDATLHESRGWLKACAL